MSRFLKLKMKTEGKNDYKNPKDFSYQLDKTKKEEDKKKKNIKQKKKKIKQIKNYHCG